jgi:hypothetical protein
MDSSKPLMEHFSNNPAICPLKPPAPPQVLLHRIISLFRGSARRTPQNFTDPLAKQEENSLFPLAGPEWRERKVSRARFPRHQLSNRRDLGVEVSAVIGGHISFAGGERKLGLKIAVGPCMGVLAHGLAITRS